MPLATDAKLDHMSESVVSKMSLGKQVHLWLLPLNHFRSLSLVSTFFPAGALQFYGRLGMGEEKPQSWKTQVLHKLSRPRNPITLTRNTVGSWKRIISQLTWCRIMWSIDAVLLQFFLTKDNIDPLDLGTVGGSCEILFRTVGSGNRLSNSYWLPVSQNFCCHVSPPSAFFFFSSLCFYSTYTQSPWKFTCYIYIYMIFSKPNNPFFKKGIK